MSILFFIIIPPLIHSLKDVIKTPVPAPKKTFQCTFQMIVDGEVVNLKKSKLSCSPAKPKNQKVSNLKIDGELGSYLVSISINPSRIKTVGILISGGDYDQSSNTNPGTSVEVFNPRTDKSCEFKPLPDERSDHTMDGLTVCGGDKNMGPHTTNETRSTCITFSSGQWRTSHHLLQPRYGHVSWVTDEGIMLLFPNGVTETAIQGKNKTEPGFTLLHDLNFACAIKDQTSNSVVITGGDYLFKSKNTVSRYGLTGFIEDMPSMNVERKWHGCGSYFRKDGTQVLLVAGGTEAYDHLEGHTSTELLIGSSSDWVFSKPLPRPHFLMGSVTMDGVVYFTGGMENFLYDNIYDEILAWIDEAWVEVGKMKIARRGHAATFIQMDDGLMQHCN